MTTAAERAYERLLGLEARAVTHLDATTRDVVTLTKAYASVEVAVATLHTAVSDAVHAARRDARDAAAKSIADECGDIVLPSGEADADRGAKAAAYYTKHWCEALDTNAEWPVAVELAREAAVKALGHIASFEVFDAWNDEHRRALATINAAAEKKARGRWTTMHDRGVCVFCQKLDGKYSDANGKFPDDTDWPPLHVGCRCFVVLDSKKEDEQMNVNAVRSNAPRTDAMTLAKSLVFKSIDVAKRTVDFVASTDIIDAHGEIVDQDSWILDDYLANPVILFAHDSRDLPIGRAVDVAVRNGPRGRQLEVRVEFATEEMNPKAEQVFQMVKEKFLRAVSVGFKPRSYRIEMRNGEEVWVWADCVLKEISVTPVPANPEALAKMKSKALSERNGPANLSGASNINPPALPGLNPSNDEEEANMDLKEALAKIETLTAKNATLESEARANSERTTTLTKQVELSEKQATDATAEAKKLATEKSALEAQCTKLVAERDEEKAKREKAEKDLADGVKKAEDAAAEAEVAGLVTAKTLDASEKDVFVELRKSNPALFTKMIAQRGPAKGQGDPNLTKSVIAEPGADKGQPAPLNVNVKAKEALTEISKLGEGIVQQ